MTSPPSTPSPLAHDPQKHPPTQQLTPPRQLGNEITAGAADWREQYDLSTTHPLPARDAPLWHNLRAPNQWPPASKLPAFRAAYEEYLSRMSTISTYFTSLIAEALGLSPSAFDGHFDADQQHKLKLVRYPDASAGAAGQGVGPHKDSMLTSYLLQASGHAGLQAQNPAGAWIDVAPVEGTLVVAVGQGLEALTGGVCASTTHRVLSPEAGKGARYSVPFFQGVAFDASFEPIDMPADVRAEREEVLRRSGGRRDDVEFTFVKGRWRCLGEATLMNRIKSHQDVGERWVRAETIVSPCHSPPIHPHAHTSLQRFLLLLLLLLLLPPRACAFSLRKKKSRFLFSVLLSPTQVSTGREPLLRLAREQPCIYASNRTKDARKSL